MGESNGIFWQASSPTRSRGHYGHTAAGRPELELLAPIVDDPSATEVTTTDGTSRIIYSTQADKAVKSFAPVLIHGELDTGELLTLLSAQNHAAGPILPKYRARVAILGAHVDANHAYSAMRFRVSDRYWTDHLSPGESAQTADLSVLRTEAAEDGVWLIYEGAKPRNIRDLEQYVANACITLMTLAFDFRPTIQEVELRTHDGPWLRTAGPGFRGQASDWDVPMLNTSDLTLDRIARWIDLNARLDNLGAAIADPPTGAVQAQALVATTLLEGIHRRLPFEQSRFPSLSKTAKRRIRKAARSAAVEAATSSAGADVGAVDKAISDCLSHFSSVSYLDRAHDIVAEVSAAVPELIFPVPDLPRTLKEARNDLAHHLVETESIDDLVTVINRWTIASMATPWLLRFLLLLRVGINPAILRRKALEHQRFEFVLANIARIADELNGVTD
ncbi:HEPN domain-containing protein [Dietzia sp. UCD-THP]|uniref:HEPN domain-containing protein n=1 Tax=Dietzia sp. UCD-THP TaxID=1292020 RepID=UPI0003A18709|nr:HEPN domain-containing protein [Dietzia sp. UCD-THP]